MRKRLVITLAVAMCSVAAGVAFGHFHTFWPDSPNGYARLGQEVTWQYFWGHPYERIVFDAPEPDVYAVTPEGERVEVEPVPTPRKDPATGKARKTFTFTYTPDALGDSWLVLEAPAIFIEEEGGAVKDYVKQCVHVMAEKGWDRPVGLPVEVLPLTRPYGLEEGFAFSGQVLADGEPLPNATVEIEKLNSFHVTDDMLPTDQFGMEDVPMITRVARTDPDGCITYTLDEPGWWMISASVEQGTYPVEDKEYPLTVRGGLWVHVEDSMTLKP